jgi:hypothetical protein
VTASPNAPNEEGLDRLDVAFRAHAVPHPSSKAGGKRRPAASLPATRPARTPAEGRGPSLLLVFDTETLVDETQALTFGCWRLLGRASGRRRWVCLEEGLLYADDLPMTDPAGYAVLQHIAATSPASIDRGLKSRLALLSRSEFVEQKLFGAGWMAKARIVGFNLPFDLSRLALSWSAGRGRNLNGFSFILAAGKDGHAERKHRPRLQIKHLNSTRAQIGFTSAMGQKAKWLGDFVDLRTLTFALTGRKHSLDSACAAFRVGGKADPGEHGTITADYVAYCRQDVAATADLYEAAEAELLALDLPITAPYAYSPASLAKATLRGLGVRPVLERHPNTDPELLGLAMSAFYGGRAECRIRKTEVPVRLVDFTSTYPTLFALMDLWTYVIADRIDTVRGPEAVVRAQALLDAITVDGGFDAALWPQLVGYVQIRPDGDILPVRAKYDPHSPAWNIGINRYTDPDPRWFALPDVLASTLLTGKAPVVLDAVFLEPVGTADGLRPLRLPGGRTVDPTHEDPFKVMTEERARVRAAPDVDEATRDRVQRFLKISSNAGAYGIWAEYNQRDLPIGQKHPVDVYAGDGDPFTVRVHAPEDPGRVCFPPLAAVLTAGARLLLALLERCVADAGGVWAFADTDSMAIVATETGGPIPCEGGLLTDVDASAVLALTFEQVEVIRTRFASLNPYDQDVIPGSILKAEVDALAYVIAAKRYALYRYDMDGMPRLVPAAEHEPCSHGLGHLLNPIDPDEDPDGERWVVQLWEHELAKVLIPDKAGAAPSWYDRPTLSRIAATSPGLLRVFHERDRGRGYRQSVKPFNFLMFAPGAAGFCNDRGLLVAPWTRQTRWAGLWWSDMRTLARLQLSTDRSRPGSAHANSYCHHAGTYLSHSEAKSSSADGDPCKPWTLGLLGRRHAIAETVSYVGKETNRLSERSSGLLGAGSRSEVQATYLRLR